MSLLDRRSFFRNMFGGLAATAAVRTWPFRVYSFPTEIVQVHITEVATWETDFDVITAQTLASLREDILYDNFFLDSKFIEKMRQPITEFHGGDGMQTPFEYNP